MVNRRFFVITPVLNGAEYISQTLASIDAQTLGDWVHYVVDGGSTDGTTELVRKSLETEPRRRLLQGKDRGLYDAVFRGFEAAEVDGLKDNDICLWLNADDLLAPWAFATMRLAFDIYNADWVTGQPGLWDSEGRLVMVRASGWYPRRWIKSGWFNGLFLGWIQQESTFFTARLLRRLAPETVQTIRSLRMAGDFLLWQAFAEFSPLRFAPTFIGGFRAHQTNLSIEGAASYMCEARTHGAFIPPAGFRHLLRFFYRIAASWLSGRPAQHLLRPPQ